MVATDIGRHIASRSWFHGLCVYLTLVVTAKTADSGARICVMAALKPKENHVSDSLPLVAARTALLTAHARTHFQLSTVKVSVLLQVLDYVLMMCVLGRVLQLLADARPVPPVSHDTEASLLCCSK